MDGHGFGWALDELKAGRKVKRSAWTGSGIYLALQVPDVHSKMQRPYLYVKNKDRLLEPYIASNGELLASDWVTAE